MTTTRSVHRLPLRLPPTVRGACAAVKATEAALPAPVAPEPAPDAPLPEILADQAAALAKTVEAAAPGAMESLRRERRARDIDEAIDGVLARCPLDETVLMLDLQPAREHERGIALGRRSARCGGSAARLRAYLRDDWHPRHAELAALHGRLIEAEDRLSKEFRALQR
jgi:hypothetical protein